jgi:transketolase
MRAPQGRDYFVLSKGHGVMAQYACMHELRLAQRCRHLKATFSDGSVAQGLVGFAHAQAWK